MFCPKCGRSNQDDIAYCRECGENLQVVSQAIKGHLSVALVSKIDAVIEKKNERFRRDAFLNGLMGVAFLFAGIFRFFVGASLPFLNFVWVILGFAGFLTSVWNFLEYRRSLELKSRPLLRQNAVTDLSDDGSATYCPSCGLQNANTLAYCPSCGTDLNLKLPAAGMNRYLPQFLIKRLDTAVAKNEATPFKPQYKSGSTLFVISALFLFSAIMGGINHDWSSVATNVVIGLSLVVSGSWNLIAFRRNNDMEIQSRDHGRVSVADTTSSYMSFNWKIVVLLFAVVLGALFYFGSPIGFPIALFVAIIAVASFLKFREREIRGQFPDRNSSSTPEFSQQDAFETRRLNPPPASVTERTTRVLEPLARPLDREKAQSPTT